ncbi:MAG: tetratricopeptide repeat protein [Neomegalonema sp.]|nr:tetratricopeptide repeat protein [Neomegalonema sp.]
MIFTTSPTPSGIWATARLRALVQDALRSVALASAALILTGALFTPAHAQEPEPAPEASESRPAPLTPAERIAKALDELKSEDEAVWKPAQAALEKAWQRSGSDSMDLLLLRAQRAMKAAEPEKARRHLTDLVNLAPDFAAGWSLRGALNLAEGDVGAALADIAYTLALEPNEFQALTGLGQIYAGLGDEKRALFAFRAALEIHPHYGPAAEAVERLVPMVEGLKI